MSRTTRRPHNGRDYTRSLRLIRRNRLRATAREAIGDFAQYGSRIPSFDDISYEDVFATVARQRDAEDFT